MTARRPDPFDAVLRGEPAGRVPVSAWRHFTDHEQDPVELARATVDFVRRWDWDWVKINPRATYYSEVWGNVYDPDDYVDVFPRLVAPAVTEVADLDRVAPVAAADAPALAEQLEAVRLIRRGLPDRPLLQTVFSPLSVLYFLAAIPSYVGPPYHGARPTLTPGELLADRPRAHRALRAIAATLADYVTELRRAGADGIFYAETGTAHPDIVSPADFREFSTPYDLVVLDAARGSRTVLHTCGDHSDPARFAGFGADALSWDPHAEGNPELTRELGPVPVGGVDHRLFVPGGADRIAAQAAEAVRAHAGRPFLLAPDCSVPIVTTDEDLAALRDAA